MASEQNDRRLDTAEGLTALEGASLSALSGLAIPVKVRIGSASITVGELLSIGAGAVIALDQRVDEPVEVVIGDRVVARGELVSIDDEMGVRITEIAGSVESER
ncbi:MAG: FliM/FliN family flagellar motor switch protein [Armatimonadota bacterium]